MSGVASTSFVLAGLWLATAVAAAAVVNIMMEASDPGPERDAIESAILRFVWTLGLLFSIGHGAAGVGLRMQQPWGKAMAWIMVPWSLLFVPIGTGIGIYHIFALRKHA